MENNKEKKVVVEGSTKPTTVVAERNILDSITGKYTVKPIKKTYLATENPKHDGAVLYSKAFVLFQAGRFMNGLTNTGLTPELEQAFEKEMFKKPGTLSKYNSEFWSTYTIKIKREGTKLDCDNSIPDKLAYLVLKAEAETEMGKVVMSEAEKQLNAFSEYIVLSDEVEARSKTKDLNIKMKAFAYLSTMSSEDWKDFLNVWKEGKYKINDSTKLNLIEAKVQEVVDEFPEQFLEIVNNPQYKDMIFLGKCFTNRLVNKIGSKYVTLEGETIGQTYLEAVSNLSAPDYNGVKGSLAIKLQAIK